MALISYLDSPDTNLASFHKLLGFFHFISFYLLCLSIYYNQELIFQRKSYYPLSRQINDSGRVNKPRIRQF